MKFVIVPFRDNGFTLVLVTLIFIQSNRDSKARFSVLICMRNSRLTKITHVYCSCVLVKWTSPSFYSPQLLFIIYTTCTFNLFVKTHFSLMLACSWLFIGQFLLTLPVPGIRLLSLLGNFDESCYIRLKKINSTKVSRNIKKKLRLFCILIAWKTSIFTFYCYIFFFFSTRT